VRRALLALGLALLVAAPAGWADPSFGLGAVSTLPAAFAPLRLAGVRTVKITADWSAIEPAAGRFLWPDVDAAVAAARREGLRPVLVLAYTPVWASLATGADARDPRVATRMPPRRVADWERFVGEAVRRYRDVVKEWQVWTLPALPHFRGTTSEYLTLLVAARRASLAADPASRVVAASPPGFDLIHVQRAVTQAADAASIVSLAPIGLSPEQWLRPLAALRQRVLAGGGRPLWVEWTADRPEANLGALVRAAAVARAAGVERLFIIPDLRRPEEPVRAVLAALEALPFTGYLVREPGVYALVFGAGAGAALLAWRSEGQTALEVPVLPTARVVTLDVRPVALSAEGKVSLTLGPVPVFVSGVGAALVEEAKAALAQRGPLLPVVPAERDFSQVSEVSIRLGREVVERGLYSVLRARRNGVVEAVEVNGEGAVRAAPGREAAFIYFDVDDTFLFFNDGRFDMTVAIEVLGARAPQSVGFNLFYDSRSGYRFTPWQWVDAREGWVTSTFRLEDANFANTAGWDFAINAGANRPEGLTVRALTVRKVAR